MAGGCVPAVGQVAVATGAMIAQPVAMASLAMDVHVAPLCTLVRAGEGARVRARGRLRPAPGGRLGGGQRCARAARRYVWLRRTWLPMPELNVGQSSLTKYGARR